MRVMPSFRSGAWRLQPLAAALLLASSLGGCETIPSSGDPLAPVKVSAPTPAKPAPTPAPDAAEPADGFDFAGEDRTESEASSEELDPVALQARLLGVEVAERPAPPPAPGPLPVVQAPPAPAPIGEWDPAQPLPDGSFSVRLLATLHDVHPPRAIIGMPDGTERVVQPGVILEAERLIVMAVGRDVIQLARVVPQGFYARVETQDVRALFPAQRPAAP